MTTRRLIAVSLILVLGAGIVGFTAACLLWGVPGVVASPDERRVREFILQNAENRASVEFVKWGPHAKAGEWRPLTMDGTLGDAVPHPVYRVVMIRDGQLRDSIFVATNDAIIPAPNPYGDHWLAIGGRR